MRRGLSGFAREILGRGGERMRGVGLWARGCPRVARRSERRRFTRGYILVVPSGLAIGVGLGVRAVLKCGAWVYGRDGVHGLRDA